MILTSSPETEGISQMLGQVVNLLGKSKLTSQLVCDFKTDFRRIDVSTKRLENFCGRTVPAVALVGQGNVGKSTLLNALLGTEVAVVKNGPCTPCPVVYSWGAEIKLRATLPVPSLKSITRTFPNLTALHKFLARPSLDFDVIEVMLPCEFLRKVCIIDTPGFGAADTADTKDHLRRLTDFLRAQRCPVYWCIKSTQPIDSDALAFYRDHLLGLCDDIIITFADSLSQSSRDVYAERYTHRFPDERMPPIHFVDDESSVGDLAQNIVASADHEFQKRRLFDDLCEVCGQIGGSLPMTKSGTAPYAEVLWNNEFVHSGDPHIRELAKRLLPKT